ncbi:exopolysaccharide biosynthesis polyprenyl glycosylphosphotransferase [Sphingomonas guangdongensis]|uniref:Exopolysaccharide biosynthesis polyprenyl glycosylphosphotransferase n=1 Tax=Sphingomonas guangdongensis TaxID=1141890 RepID=A0A285QF91_9SPHN|nr:sugar transferase [Sphingomonas guangdongensis]SOB80600.1 exopolysaccharide biosynthesis polyprenyl glycosylphosphotransferase [Sphingomonas guangdongensis]
MTEYQKISPGAGKPVLTDEVGSALPEVVHALARRVKHRRALRILALIGDVVAIFLSFAAAATVWYGNPLDNQARDTVAAIVPIYVLIGLTQHIFTMALIARAKVSAFRACGSLIIAIGLVGLVAFFLQAVGGVSRAVVGLGTVAAIVSVATFRSWLALHAHKLLGEVTINEVVIRDGVAGDVHHGSIVLDATRDNIGLRLDSPAMLDRLGRCLQRADRVIVMCPPERRVDWVSALKSANVNGEIRAGELDAIGAIGLRSYNGGTTLAVASAPLALSDQVLKRALDLSLVIAAMPVVLPIMAATALAVKLDSRGPVFFRQPRVGLGNRVFRMYKFRSMRVAQGDLAGSTSTRRNDSRITRVGAFIRKTSLDELPQVLNVLTGDMSIVGPRPHPLECKAEDQLFWDIDGRYWHRHAVKPGMTGLAQIRGFRGATETTSDLTNRLQADLEYVSGWSLWRDLAIIVATFRVLSHKNAF